MSLVMIGALAFATQLPDHRAADTLRISLSTADRPLAAVEELRLGSLEGPEETSFGWVGDIAVAADGTMYVPDVQVPAVRIFDATGRYVGDLGREGEGPGEYQALRGIDVLPDGSVAVWHEMGDVTLFGPDGAFVRRFSLSFLSLAGGPGPGLVADTAGRVLVRTTTGPPASNVLAYAWVRATAGGELVDSIVPPDRDLGGSPFAFRAETFSAPSPLGYFVVGRTTEYALHRPTSDGRVVTIERTFEPVPIQGEERAQWDAYIDAVEAARGDDWPAMNDEKPAWKDFSVGYDGRIWVRRYVEAVHRPEYVSAAARSRAARPNVNWVEPVRYDVVDPRGAYLGTVELPEEGTLLRARGARVWMLERGDFDEFYVVRYRVEGLAGVD